MTESLAPDEKVCPFCAEVIKIAAIKCRYCQSELPAYDETAPVVAEDPAPSAEPEAAPDQESQPESEPGPESDPVTAARVASWRTGIDKVLVGLVVLCVLLAGVLTAIVLSAKPDSLHTADNGQVTAEDYRSAAMSAAAANAKAILTYSYKTLDENIKAAHTLMTPAFAKEYDTELGKLRAATLKSKLTQTGTVLSVSLISLTKHDATVMMLTNIVNVPEGSKDVVPQSVDRVEMKMERKDGDWFVSKMNPF